MAAYDKVEIGNGTFYVGDCFDVMRDLPDGSVDMVVTSPPYDNLRTYNDGDAWTWEVFERVAGQLARTIKQGGVIVWNVADASIGGTETGSSFRQALHFKDHLGLRLHDTMIYLKETYVPLNHKRYEQEFEYMFVLSKNSPTVFNGIRDKPNVGFGRKVTGTSRNKDGSTKPLWGAGKKRIAQFGLRGNVWRMAPAKGGKVFDHPAMFPHGLADDHIHSWSDTGHIVLDPFGGSGTTAIAAENAGRRWICIERDPEYAEKAIERIRAYVGEVAPQPLEDDFEHLFA